jgi:hypothetical protein
VSRLVPGPSSTLSVPYLNPELTAQALQPLPESAHLFQEALRGPDILDESELGVWKDGPPYAIDCTETGSARELHFTERLVEVVHGVRLRGQREDDQVRRLEFMKRDRKEALGALAVEVAEMVDGWDAMRLFVRDYHAGPRALTMAQVHLRWQARTIYHVAHLLFL